MERQQENRFMYMNTSICMCVYICMHVPVYVPCDKYRYGEAERKGVSLAPAHTDQQEALGLALIPG